MTRSALRITAVVSLFFGVAFSMILDGQVFRQAVIAAASGCVAAVCAWQSERGIRTKGRMMIIAWLGLAMTILSILAMSSAKRSQDRFNQLIEKVKVLREK